MRRFYLKRVALVVISTGIAVVLFHPARSLSAPATQPDETVEQAQAEFDTATAADLAKLNVDPAYRDAKSALELAVQLRSNARNGGTEKERADAAAAWLSAINNERRVREAFVAGDLNLKKAHDTLDATLLRRVREENEAKRAQQIAEGEQEVKRLAEIAKANALPSPVAVGNANLILQGVALSKIGLMLGGSFDHLSGSAPLVIHVKIENQTQDKKIEYDSWDPEIPTLGQIAYLTDNFGNRYKRIDFGIYKPSGRLLDHDSVYPDSSLSEVLCFETPIDTAQFLVLHLPNKNVGGVEGITEFKIPIGAVKRN